MNKAILTLSAIAAFTFTACEETDNRQPVSQPAEQVSTAPVTVSDTLDCRHIVSRSIVSLLNRSIGEPGLDVPYSYFKTEVRKQYRLAKDSLGIPMRDEDLFKPSPFYITDAAITSFKKDKKDGPVVTVHMGEVSLDLDDMDIIRAYAAKADVVFNRYSKHIKRIRE